MNTCCDCSPPQRGSSREFRVVLWAALVINLAMFSAEIIGSIIAGSSALQADALDFLADAANYGISLAVAGLALVWRARAALIKGATMGLFGLGVLASTAWHAVNGTVPHAEIMGVIGIAALLANGAVATMLFAYRAGDSNMRSIWLCSRNDVIGNIAVLFAAAGVFGTGAGWPDFAVALGMAVLEMSAATQIVRRALRELRPIGGAALPAE
jgi:Co/Zn/Cd efflux system component